MKVKQPMLSLMMNYFQGLSDCLAILMMMDYVFTEHSFTHSEVPFDF